MQLSLNLTAQLFSLGEITISPGARRACSPEFLAQCLARHASGDWGPVLAATAAENDQALMQGDTIGSMYPIDPPQPAHGEPGNALWIETNADRTATILLLPEEYEA